MNPPDRKRIEERIVDEEAEAAAEEAAEIGGEAPDSDDPAQRPLIEAGEGEAEGFELAEKQLEEIAEHGDEHRFPDRDVRPAEDADEAEFGEADESIHPDA